MSDLITRADLATIETPEATATWQPVPHTTLIDGAERALNLQGWSIESQTYEADKDGARLFATWAIVNGTRHEDYRLSVGIRNAHDKAFAAGIGLGAFVLVCSNLDFAADFLIGRKAHERDPARSAGPPGGHLRPRRALRERARFPGREVFKETNTFDLSARTTRLHGLLGAVALEAGNDPRQAALELPTTGTANAPEAYMDTMCAILGDIPGFEVIDERPKLRELVDANEAESPWHVIPDEWSDTFPYGISRYGSEHVEGAMRTRESAEAVVDVLNAAEAAR